MVSGPERPARIDCQESSDPRRNRRTASGGVVGRRTSNERGHEQQNCRGNDQPTGETNDQEKDQSQQRDPSGAGVYAKQSIGIGRYAKQGQKPRAAEPYRRR